jgi:hypothetical protein
LNAKSASVDGFFAAYPDGFLVSIVRDPRAWYSSLLKQSPDRYGDVDAAVERWRMSTDAALEARERHGDRVLVITYEALVSETEPTMARLADAIGISMSPILLEPTFNGQPIRANSSEAVGGYGVRRERTTGYREVLDADTIARIDTQTGPLYRRVVEELG